MWLSQLNESQTDVINVDVPYYMSRATLDIIGLAGLHAFTTRQLSL